MPFKNIPRIFLLLAFIEGFTVMAVEILSVKMISPFYGNSHSLWTAVLAITLFGLAIGYFLGGQLAKGKENPSKILLHLLSVSGILIVGMSYFANDIMICFFKDGFLTAIIMTPICLVLPPLITLGCTSPVIIKASEIESNSSGKTSGIIFTISTLGGVLGAFLFGLIIIPNWGVAIPSVLIGLALFILSFTLFVKKEKPLHLGILLIVMLTVFSFTSFNIVKQKHFGTEKVEFVSEGVLGQIKVTTTNVINGRDQRAMMLNNVSQTRTFLNENDAESYWIYPHIISIGSLVIPSNSDALVLGFGAGSNVDELVKRGFRVDAVDLDDRLIDVAEDYFYHDQKNSNFIIDDARHFIRTTNKKYDLIVLDVLKGEVQPNYMLSIECFTTIKEIMNDDALLILNFQGYVDGEHAISFQSIYKTLSAAGFHLNLFVSTETGIKDIVYFASKRPFKFDEINYNDFNDCCKRQFPESPLSKLHTKQYEYKNAYLLQDDRPILDHINQSLIFNWRKDIIEHGVFEGNGYKQDVFL
ncbi:MAG: fused MFS/spermidine synthase [Flavobacteriales bacterium]|nr:fused MFS/spermidine synthase [Flavobacteriales bacterium]